ncbi:transmembrane protein 30A [Phyllostomus discolor]|uniref:Cytochrome c oxidase subunit 7A2, mitochondrial n=1 Tax=Phyllostomus discolor TaxID=89673 RepID=A0A834AL63_9CHIR|nr:transmembrane protein 30A [Phyllostomus discolor]
MAMNYNAKDEVDGGPPCAPGGTAKNRRPDNTAFKQQRLPAWQPILTAGTVLPTFFIIGLIFIPIGIGIFVTSNNIREIEALRQVAQRTITTASRRQFENKVPEKQKLFQEDNGIPVHLKGGVADALLYRATMILTVGGAAYAIYQLAMASLPKKQN